MANIDISASLGADIGNVEGSIAQNTLLTNGRDGELESDELGVLFTIQAGYTPMR